MTLYWIYLTPGKHVCTYARKCVYLATADGLSQNPQMPHAWRPSLRHTQRFLPPNLFPSLTLLLPYSPFFPWHVCSTAYAWFNWGLRHVITQYFPAQFTQQNSLFTKTAQVICTPRVYSVILTYCRVIENTSVLDSSLYAHMNTHTCTYCVGSLILLVVM